MIDEHNFKKYTDYWGKNRIMARAVMAHKPKYVLEVGCGEGKLIKLLRDEGIDARGIDILGNGKYAPDCCRYGSALNIPFPDMYFNVVVSNDFFEHIKEEEVPLVYAEMKRVAPKIIARISLKEKDNHLTVKPISWWKEKLPGCEFVGKDWNKL